MRRLLTAISLLVLCFAAVPPPGPALAQGTATETVGFSIQIEPVFSLRSRAEQGGTVNLSRSGPEQGASTTRTAVVTVRNNTGRPYRITQRLEQNLVTGSGADLQEGPVYYTVSDGVNGGGSEVKSPVPLTTQLAVVFTSGPKGESDEFRISYSLARELVRAGQYQARILIEEDLR